MVFLLGLYNAAIGFAMGGLGASVGGPPRMMHSSLPTIGSFGYIKRLAVVGSMCLGFATGGSGAPVWTGVPKMAT
jgi:hypothetical protein